MQPSEVKVAWNDNYRTSQIYSRGFEFAFLSESEGVFYQATTFVYCKDFLHDAIWATLNKKPVRIYGFKYDPSKDVALQMDRTVLALRNTEYRKKDEDGRFHEQLAACLEFVQQIDRRLGFRPTQIYVVEHADAPCWAIVGDARWQHAPTLLSLYTLLLRLGFLHRPGQDSDKTLQLAGEEKKLLGDACNYAGNLDCRYVKEARVGIDLIMRHGLNIFHPKQEDNYPSSLDVSTLHNFLGIVNFSKQAAKEEMPHWFRDEIWKDKTS